MLFRTIAYRLSARYRQGHLRQLDSYWTLPLHSVELFGAENKDDAFRGGFTPCLGYHDDCYGCVLRRVGCCDSPEE